MAQFTPPPGLKLDALAYQDFQGLDTSRDPRSMDTGERQHLVTCNNGTCDFRGQIVRDPVARLRGGTLPVVHMRHYGLNQLAWAELTGAGISFTSDADHRLDNVYPRTAIISSTVFNQRVVFGARNEEPRRYNGVIWSEFSSPALATMRPSYYATSNRRMVVAGIPGRETQVHFSRVDNDDVFPDDEDPESNSVLRAGYIDVANLLSTADVVTGIGAFEQNRLAVFTNDKTFIYRIDPDITRWTLDDNANINVGCLSHNTIQKAGTDLMFCSRDGVHSIRRSETNGILVFSVPLSEKIDQLYRQYVREVQDPNEISAVFDQDENQYHIFFPMPGRQLARRLTVTLATLDGESLPKWTTGDFLNARCGAFLAGQLSYGTSGGVYDVQKIESQDGVAPTLTVTTPPLYLGSMSFNKDTHSYTLQMLGRGNLTVEVFDDQGRVLQSDTFDVDDSPDDNEFLGVPLSREFHRQLQHRALAFQFRFTVKGQGVLRIVGFAVNVRKN